ncbi:hypothetical protein ACIKTA_16490, partial [Hansschlegelia beijingensis]
QQAIAFGDANGYLPPHHYDQIFTAHGVIMIFFMLSHRTIDGVSVDAIVRCESTESSGRPLSAVSAARRHSSSVAANSAAKLVAVMIDSIVIRFSA